LQATEFTESAIKQFRHRLNELRLKVASTTYPTRRPLYEKEFLDDRVATIKKSMLFTWKLDTRIMTFRIGRLPEAESKEYKLLVDVLNDLAGHGNHIGVTPAITPTQESPAALKQLFECIKDGPIGLDLDPTAFITAGHKPTEAVRVLFDRVLHVQARDGLRDVDGNGVETEVGRGQVDWIELIALLHEADYHGWLTAIRNQGQQPGLDVARALKFLQQFAFA